MEKCKEYCYEVIGFKNGFSGVNQKEYVHVRSYYLELEKAGSFLGCSREQANNQAADNLKKLGIDALIVMGGDDSLKEAYKLSQQGVKVVGWPKTMDNDLSGTYFCLGYPTAVESASRMLRDCHNDALTNNRIHLVTMFGRETDWMVTGAGAWGVADLIIPGEKEYELEFISQKIEEIASENEKKYHRRFGVIAAAEGAQIKGLESHLDEEDFDSYGHPKIEPMKLALILKKAFKTLGNKKVGIDSISYAMRNRPPVYCDKKWAMLLGEKCVEMIKKGQFGQCAIITAKETIDTAPLEKVIKKRFLQPTNFLDYENLRVNRNFIDYYYLIFGEPLLKVQLMYKANLERR
jgi:6-phosphofructokinase 1